MRSNFAIVSADKSAELGLDDFSVELSAMDNRQVKGVEKRPPQV